MNNFHYHQDSLYSAAARILEGASEVQALVKDFAVGDNTNFGKVLEIGADSITFKAKDLPKTRITFNQRKMGSSEFLLTKLLKLKEETLDEASMDSLSLSDLWNKHREYTYAADQGWGGGYGSAKGGKAAAEAIYKFVSAKYDKKTAEDMQDASDNYLGYQEYVGGAEAKSAKADEEKLRKKYGIKESKMQEETLDEAYAAYKPLRKPEDLVAELQSIVDTPDSKLWDVTSVSLRLSHEDIFDRFPKIYDYVEDMWEAIMTPDGARKTKEIAKKAIEAVHKYYPIKEETEESEETLDEAINWLGDYLPTSEKSKFGGYRPTIINKQTKGLMYQSAAAYNTPQEAKDHAEDYLKQKSKGIKDPKVPLVGTYKEETEEEVTEAVDPTTKRRKQLDMARVNAGAMSRDDYDKKYKLGKYSPAGSKLSGPGGLYKNLVKEVLNPDDDASVWIDDFVKSDDPRFEGKSKEERIKMALGAWYAAQKKESTEPTTEVLEEAAMTAAEKKIAQEVHDALKDGEQVGQTYGMQIRSQHNKLTSKFGKDWRKIAGIKEETVVEERAESLEESEMIEVETQEELVKIIKKDPVLKKWIGKRDVYFDNTDLVVGDKTAMSNPIWDDGTVDMTELRKMVQKNITSYDQILQDAKPKSGETKVGSFNVILPKELKGTFGGPNIPLENPRAIVRTTTDKGNAIKKLLHSSSEGVTVRVMARKGDVAAVYIDAKDTQGFSNALKKLASDKALNEMTTLEEVVALPSVKKVIDVIDEMTPKEYSNFLHALADNAFGISVMARRTKPKGPSNADAWEDVADGIRDAAKAYDARPVNIYKTNECVEETLDERVRMQLVFKAADAVTALEDEEFEEFLKRLADKLERTGKKAGYKDAVNVASLLKKAYGTWKARKDTKDWKEDTKEQGEALQEAVYPLTKKALDATFNLDPDEFEEFLKELAKNLNNEGDDTGYDEWYQVADHIEKAHKIWKARDSNI